MIMFLAILNVLMIEVHTYILFW